MLKLPALSRRLAQRAAVCVVLIWWNAAVLASPADYAPLPPAVAASEAADAVSRFLVEKGLIGAAPGDQIAREIRNQMPGIGFLRSRLRRQVVPNSP